MEWFNTAEIVSGHIWKSQIYYENIKRLGHKNDIPSTSTLRSIKISIELPLCTHCSWKEDACSCITKIKDKTLGQFMSLLNG